MGLIIHSQLGTVNGAQCCVRVMSARSDEEHIKYLKQDMTDIKTHIATQEAKPNSSTDMVYKIKTICTAGRISCFLSVPVDFSLSSFLLGVLGLDILWKNGAISYTEF